MHDIRGTRGNSDDYHAYHDMEVGAEKGFSRRGRKVLILVTRTVIVREAYWWRNGDANCLCIMRG